MFERRTKMRVRLKEPIETVIEAVYQAKMLDISPDGALLELHRPLPPGLECDLRIGHSAEEVHVSATTRRCRTGGPRFSDEGHRYTPFLVGLQFGDDHRESVERLLARVTPTEGPPKAVLSAKAFPGDSETVQGTRWISGSDITVSVRISGADALEPHPMILPPEGER